MGYAHIYDIMQPMFVNGMCPAKSLKTSLLSPGKPRNLVFAIPGKSWRIGILMFVRTLYKVLHLIYFEPFFAE